MGTLGTSPNTLRVPLEHADPKKHAQLIALGLNNVIRGKLDAIGGPITLTANSAVTTISDARVSANCFLAFMPLTANGATEFGAGSLYVSSQTKGSFVLTHVNNAQTNRSFRFIILGGA